MKSVRLFLSVYFIVLIVSCTASHSDFYIAKTGDDNNIGTKNKPFRTILKAKNVVCEISKSGKSNNIIVWIGGGTYKLDETLVFGPLDSGSENSAVIYRGIPGEKIEFSGGMEVSGWEKVKKGLWVAQLSLKGTENSDFRELFIDGQRAIRARHPDAGYLRIAEVGKDRRTNFRFNKKDFPIPENATDVELVVLHDWSISRISLKEIDSVKKTITAIDTIGSRSISFFNLDNWEKNPRYFLENSLEFCESNQEWYYDKKDKLLYLNLKEGESPVNKKIIIPYVKNRLLILKGAENQRIKNIHFENITFSYCSWPLPEKGYAGIQACFFDPQRNQTSWSFVPTAIESEWAEDCSFVKCTFSHLGGSGLCFGRGSEKCFISDCRFEDISGNGVMIGEGNDRTIDGELWWKKKPDEAASGNKILNSTITSCGEQFFGAVGIWSGLAVNTSIVNNHIYNLPYSGISIGWMWSPDPTPCRNNILEGNHIHNVMQTLSDGGGIYMLGLQPESKIVSNNIHDIPLNAGRAESNGMFLDEGTTNVEIRDNLIYKVAKSPLRFHKATVNLVKDNILACSDDNPPIRYNSTPEKNIVLENNQILKESNVDDMKTLESIINKRIKY